MARTSTKATPEKATPEVSKGLRNFRQTQDIENFYRFIHDNALRREAKVMVDEVYKHLLAQKKKAEAKKKAKGRRAAKKKQQLLQ